MDSFVHLIETVVICTTILFVAAMVLLVVVMRMESNPLKDVLSSLLWRVGATVGILTIGLPIQPVPDVDVAYDLGGTIVLAIYWIGFIKDVVDAVRSGRR